MKITVIDGQGGKIGRSIIEAITKSDLEADITAVGTNSIATSNMIKGGAENAATGENPVVVACRHAEVIVGPIGIVIADSLNGEVTPVMAVAVGQSEAKKVLIPVNRCNNVVVGVKEMTMAETIQNAVEQIRICCEK